MRRILLLSGFAAVLLLLGTGCAGPEQKLGRGVSNVTEFVRMGEIRRTVEQTMLEEGPNTAYTRGVIKGFNRSVARTLVGAYEIVTFPIPSYEPWLKPGNRYIPDASVKPVYPDSYKPSRISTGTFDTDVYLGFSGGDIAPFVPGSRFRVFDN